jgi:nitroimidazol reductase NimA-like FMN-containing flavoprotein (pyridoxamine 5'-phosphate oxidase superfamily)
MPSEPSERSRIRRAPARADYDRRTIDAILDEGTVAHVGLVADGQPFVLPTMYARWGDELYLHGSSASRLVRTLAAGAPVSVTVTLVDGLVLARSVFHHSCNYRSVVVLGVARLVEDEAERVAAMRAFTERLVPGRWDEARPPTRQELKGTQILALPLDESSAKVRTGGPVDDEEDYALDVWAGHVPVRLTAQEPIADARLPAGTPPSASLLAWLAANADH